MTVPQSWKTKSYTRRPNRWRGWIKDAREGDFETALIDKVTVVVGNHVYALPRPYRHHHVVFAIGRWKGSTYLNRCKGKTQGFMNVLNQLIDRETGRHVVEANKQPLGKRGWTHWYKLFSECVWDTPGDYEQPPGSPEREVWEAHNNFQRIDKLLMVFIIKKGTHHGKIRRLQ